MKSAEATDLKSEGNELTPHEQWLRRQEFVRHMRENPSKHDAEWWDRLRADMAEEGVHFGSE
jgi:hypothetical protein